MLGRERCWRLGLAACATNVIETVGGDCLTVSGNNTRPLRAVLK